MRRKRKIPGRRTSRQKGLCQGSPDLFSWHMEREQCNVERHKHTGAGSRSHVKEEALFSGFLWRKQGEAAKDVKWWSGNPTCVLGRSLGFSVGNGFERQKGGRQISKLAAGTQAKD